MKTARQLLQQHPCGFNFIGPLAPVQQALYQLSATGCGYLVVMDGDAYQGIFTEANVVQHQAKEMATPAWVAVGQVLHQQALPGVDLDTSVEEIMQHMHAHHASHLPVFDGFRFAGVVSIYDVLEALISNPAECFAVPLEKELDEEAVVA